MSRKRLHPTTITPKEVQALSQGTVADVEGQVVALSPKKQGPAKTYYRASVADNHSRVSLTLFSDKTADVLSKMKEQKASVLLKNVTVSQSTSSDTKHLLFDRKSEVQPSTKTFSPQPFDDASFGSTPIPKQITLDQLPAQATWQRITTKIKVLDVSPKTNVGQSKVLQNVAVSDSTGTASLTLWSAFLETLVVGKSYELKNFIVSTFDDEKTISSPFKHGVVNEINEVEDALPLEEPITKTTEITNVTITNISHYSYNLKCPKCKKGNVDVLEQNPVLGKCTTFACKTLSKIEKCAIQISATIDVDVDDKPFFNSLNVYDDVVRVIADVPSGHFDDERLITASAFNAKYNDRFIITEASRD